MERIRSMIFASFIIALLVPRIGAQGPKVYYYYHQDTELPWAECYIYHEGGSKQKIPFFTVVNQEYHWAPMGTGKYAKDTHVDARLVFIGEGPGRDEDNQGRPFVGEAGRLLTRILKAMGLARESVYICNVVKCRPPHNRDPEPDEIAACIPFLERQIRLVRPEVICTLGRIAAQTLLGQDFKITEQRGKWYSFGDIPLMPTYHPAYLLRNRNAKRDVWEDVQKIMQHLGLEVKKT